MEKTEKIPTSPNGRKQTVTGKKAGGRDPGLAYSRNNGQTATTWRPPAYDQLSEVKKTVLNLWCEGARDWDEICDATEILTGSELPNDARKALERDAQLISIMRGYIRTEVMREGPRLAWETLKEVMEDDKAQPGARIKAAEVALKWSGEVAEAERERANDPEHRPMAEWTVEELEAFISKHGASGPDDALLDITPDTKPN